MARYLEFAHALRLKADKLAKELGASSNFKTNPLQIQLYGLV